MGGYDSARNGLKHRTPPRWRTSLQSIFGEDRPMNLSEFINRQPKRADGAIVTTPNGPVAACNNFYYDLYTVDDNSLLGETLLSPEAPRSISGRYARTLRRGDLPTCGVQNNKGERKRRDAETCRIHGRSQSHWPACPGRSKKQADR